MHVSPTVHPYAEAFLVQPETPHRSENRGDSTLCQVSIHPSGEMQKTWLEDDYSSANRRARNRCSCSECASSSALSYAARASSGRSSRRRKSARVAWRY
jgi:hypothetical protein